MKLLRRAQLLSSLGLVLFASLTSATTDHKQDLENQITHNLDVSPPSDHANATLQEPLLPTVAYQATNIPKIVQDQNIFARLLARQNGCSIVNAESQTIDCGSDGLCCKNDGGGWCCANTLGCGDGNDGGYCTFRLEYTTITSSTATTTTVYDTVTLSSYSSTRWYTSTITSTVSGQDIATEINFVTVTAPARLARNVAETSPLMVATPVALSKQPASTAQIAIDRANTIHPEITEAPQFELRGLTQRLRRQIMLTSTITDTVTVTNTFTETRDITDIVEVVATSTTTSTFVRTITSVINARTTTTVDSTVTAQAALTDAETTPPRPTGRANNGGGRGSDTGLSTGAKAGIGGGVAGGVLALFIWLGVWLWRRRNKRKQTAQGIAPAGVGASPAAVGYGRQHQEEKHPVSSITQSSTPSNMRASPMPNERYSDMIAYSPVPSQGHHAYPPPSNSPPSPRRSHMQQSHGYEMSATPAPMTYYPRPPDPMQPGQQRSNTQSPVEMYHPVPVEVPAHQTPMPGYTAYSPHRGNGYA